MSRKIEKIILHCSASDSKKQTAKMIDGWHRKRGFAKIGYHYFIRHDGLIEGGRAIEEIGAHCKGQNTTSIGICLSGNRTFSDTQFESLEALLASLWRVYPKSTLHGHNEFNKNKTCPNYNVSRFNERKNPWNILKMLLKFLKLS